MAYQGLNLGDIVSQASQIKGAQQRQALGDIALQNAQTEQSQKTALNDLATSNPNFSLQDAVKAGGVTQGTQAFTALSGAQLQDLTNHYRQQYQAATAVANADDPVAAVHQVAPQFAQQYDKVHGPGAFEKLAQNPAALKQQAQTIADQSLAGLVDPDKQFQAHQTMIEDHFKEGEQTKRADANRAAEDERARLSRAVTIRGQDLEAGRANKPQLVTVQNPDGSTSQKWILPGQLDGPQVGGASPNAKLSETQGNAKAFGLRAQNANQALEAMISGPNAYDPTGIGARKDALTAGGTFNNLASDQGQKYQNLAKAFIAPILRKESGAAISESEWAQAKQLYVPIPGDSPTVLAQKAQNRQDAIEGLRVQAGPSGLPTPRQANAGVHPANIQSLLDKYK